MDGSESSIPSINFDIGAFFENKRGTLTMFSGLKLIFCLIEKRIANMHVKVQRHLRTSHWKLR